MNLSNDISFLSLNVRGLSNKKKRKVVFSWCQRQKPDICFLQETHSTPKTENEWNEEWGNKIIFSHGKSNARGTCILFKKSLDVVIQKQITDSNGRFILLFVTMNDIPYVLVNIYAPNNETKAVDFFHKIKSVLIEENVDLHNNKYCYGRRF